MNIPFDSDDAEEAAAYQRMLAAAQAGELHIIAHPDVMKCFVGSTIAPSPPWQPPQLGRSEVEPRKPHSRRKFFRVYHAPGYPIDPRNVAARALDAYVNAFAPQPNGVFDYSRLTRWLSDNVN